MNKEQIKYLLDNINCEVKSNINWIEPLGLDRDTWKSLLEYIQQKDKEIERLNNIINELEKDLREMYLTFGEFSEEYTENRIKKLKGESNEKN